MPKYLEFYTPLENNTSLTAQTALHSTPTLLAISAPD